MLKIVLRSLAYQLFLYTSTVGIILLHLPALFLDSGVMRRGFGRWGRMQTWGLKVFAGINIEIRGEENRPIGPVLVASKHQSMLETSLFFSLLDQPSIILKKELTYIPLVGPLVRKAGLIILDRKGGAEAVRQMLADARARIEAGQPILIFPEGHRMIPGAPPDYRRGVVRLYDGLDVACVPVALNSGLFWPRRTFLRYPGTVVFHFLPAIEPGLEKKEFLKKLENAIEPVSDALIIEGKKQLPFLPK